MCETTKKRLARIKMPSTTKKAMDMVMGEITNLNTAVKSLSDRIDAQTARIETMESTQVEILSMVNKINDKLTLEQVEKKAAQLELLHSLFATKRGWIVLGIGISFCAVLGLAFSFILEHYTEVSTLITAVK